MNNFIKTNIAALNLETLFRFCPDGIVCKDSNLCYLDSNKSYNTTFASTNFPAIVGKQKNPYIPEDIMKLIHDADVEVLRTHSPINYVLNIEINTLLNITTFPILHNNEFIGLISIIKDITQEEALKEAFVNKHFEYIKTEQSLQKQREAFVASLGHDLKNPTIAQIRSLELLLKGNFGNLNNEQAEIVEMVLDSCRYMYGMLSTLLATYRNDNGEIKFNFAEFLFSELVNECVSEMLYVAKDKGVIISINDSFEANTIFADRIQIKRVIMNLLSNGIKYAYKDSNIKLKIFSEKKQIGFEFENNSPYIPQDKQAKIFAQYVSYAGTFKEVGSGLGLYTSKKIINGHNGKIYLKSFKDNRNIFGFKIPIKQKIE